MQENNNENIFERVFHKGKCSGNRVYYYYMSERYERDWFDDKYDGYRVEKWASDVRYKG